MKYATPENTRMGEIVLVPIHGEYMNDAQICQEYEVVVALKCKTPAGKQIVGSEEKPMPILLEFNSETAFKYPNHYDNSKRIKD